MKSIQKHSLSGLLFILFSVFCINFTELKIDVIKVAEIVLLIMTPFLYYKTINKWVLMLFVVFTAWFLISLALNPFRDFYLLKEVSFLKRPYLITIGRFLELVACLNFTTLVYRFFKGKSYRTILTFIKRVFYLNCLLLILFLIIYFFKYFNIINDTVLVYENYRLRGWYGEGGPYGLMLAFTFCISFLYKWKFNNLFRFLILVTLVFIAKSKAGVLCVMIWYLITYYKRLYEKIRQLNILILILGGLIISVIFVKIADNYITEIQYVKKGIVQRPDDVNLIMGRIAGLFIFPEMVIDNPIFGIGLGNYPIMRNNPDYLGVIPPSPIGKTDAHGYGGIVQLLVDGGVFTLSFFFLVLYFFYQKLKKRNHKLDKYLIIFLCFFMLGVQIYFLYPWFLLGLLIALSEKPEMV